MTVRISVCFVVFKSEFEIQILVLLYEIGKFI